MLNTTPSEDVTLNMLALFLHHTSSTSCTGFAVFPGSGSGGHSSLSKSLMLASHYIARITTYGRIHIACAVSFPSYI